MQFNYFFLYIVFATLTSPCIHHGKKRCATLEEYISPYLLYTRSNQPSRTVYYIHCSTPFNMKYICDDTYHLFP